jgi:hypothetical protein
MSGGGDGDERGEGDELGAGGGAGGDLVGSAIVML